MSNTTTGTIPQSLYIHTPWCIHKCPYCDFNSHQVSGKIPEHRFYTQLLSDLESDLKIVEHPGIDSVFIGGGTPSMLSGEFFQDLLTQVKSKLTFNANAEVTLEANPGASEAEKFKQYREAGVNRLSLGVQSFSDQKLKSLGRVHNATEAVKAFHMAREAQITRINIDLMFGLPGQSINEALLDLKKAIDLNPEHISWYQLTIEKNTQFYRTPPQLPNDDLIWEMHTQGCQLLSDAGYLQYEVSAFAKPGEQSRHNLNYWQFGDYLGIGPGAHGKITNAKGEIFRSRKSRMPNSYLNAVSPRVALDQIPDDELIFEFMLNVLRLKSGVSSEILEQRTGIEFETIKPLWQPLVDKELVLPDRIGTTPLGYQYLNQVLESFLVS